MKRLRVQSSLTSWFSKPREQSNSTSRSNRSNGENETESYHANGEPPQPKKAKVVKHFNSKWLEKYSWLCLNESGMSCTVCKAENKVNSLSKGTRNYRHSTLTRHMNMEDHKSALQAASMRKEMAVVVANVLNKKQTQSDILNKFSVHVTDV